MKSFKTFNMFIHVMQTVCSCCCYVTLARTVNIRRLYIFLIIGFFFLVIIHILSTEYINIWYARSSIDTKYSAG